MILSLGIPPKHGRLGISAFSGICRRVLLLYLRQPWAEATNSLYVEETWVVLETRFTEGSSKSSRFPCEFAVAKRTFVSFSRGFYSDSSVEYGSDTASILLPICYYVGAVVAMANDGVSWSYNLAAIVRYLLTRTSTIRAIMLLTVNAPTMSCR